MKPYKYYLKSYKLYLLQTFEHLNIYINLESNYLSKKYKQQNANMREEMFKHNHIIILHCRIYFILFVC